MYEGGSDSLKGISGVFEGEGAGTSSSRGSYSSGEVKQGKWVRQKTAKKQHRHTAITLKQLYVFNAQ